MARRAFLPTLAPPPSPASPTAGSVRPPPIAASSAPSFASSPPSFRARTTPAAGVPRAPAPSSSEERLAVSNYAVPVAAAAQLLDRLAANDESAYVVSWMDRWMATRVRQEPALAVRLLRAYRELGQIESARDLAASLPPSPTFWSGPDAVRLCIERAAISMWDGRLEHASAEIQQASRAASGGARVLAVREQLEIHLVTAQVEVALGHFEIAQASLRLAEHVSERLHPGAGRIGAAMTIGHLLMRVAEPRHAARQYGKALAASPAQSLHALRAGGNLAIALASTGLFDSARAHALAACQLATEIAPGQRQADAYDVLATTEIAADNPAGALQALEDAHAALGDLKQSRLRWELANHSTMAFAMVGEAELAEYWKTRTETIGKELGDTDAEHEHEFIVTKARVYEATGRYEHAIQLAGAHATRLGESFQTGMLNVILARCALRVGEQSIASASLERAALCGEKHGWIFPERAASRPLWDMALRSGDSRVVRYAERVLTVVTSSDASVHLPPGPSRAILSRPPPSAPSSRASWSSSSFDVFESTSNDEALMYVTTGDGVQRVRGSELGRATEGATLVVDTTTHQLRVEGREVSLGRRRALEPLVVQLLRRAREGLSAEEILRAAGGPGPESTDAEHRVRVLISRVRELLGDSASIERVREAGEHGKTRYRLSPSVRFALIEPLHAS